MTEKKLRNLYTWNVVLTIAVIILAVLVYGLSVSSDIGRKTDAVHKVAFCNYISDLYTSTGIDAEFFPWTCDDRVSEALDFLSE